MKKRSQIWTIAHERCSHFWISHGMTKCYHFTRMSALFKRPADGKSASLSTNPPLPGGGIISAIYIP